MLSSLLLLSACQAPFGESRQDLRDFRVATLQATWTGPTEVVPDVVLVVEGRLWSTRPVDLAWTLVDAGDDDAASRFDGQGALATGPRPTLAVEEGAALRLVLRATSPAGEGLTAFLDLPAERESLAPPEIRIERWPRAVTELNDADLSPTRRARQATEPLQGACAPDDLLRLEALVEGGSRTRWMTTAGSFLELDEVRTEWTPGVLTLDDGEISEARPGKNGMVTWVTLALDDSGRTSSRLTDQGVGDVLEGQVPLGARWIPADQSLEGWVEATLVPAPAASGGLGLVDVEPADPPDLAAADPYGWGGRCAAPADEPWHPDTLARGLCTVSGLDGARVLLWVQP